MTDNDKKNKDYYVYIQYVEPTPAVIGVKAVSAEEAGEMVYAEFSDSLPNLEIVRVEEAQEQTPEEMPEETGESESPTVH